jgi:HD-GYP domain-containing protein (c-di-GMP phosphodiesterase class II)
MEDHGPDIPREDLAFAALFHDVGKCFVPMEILQKPDRLEQAELRYILRHPVDSGRMLQPKFGEQIAEIARNHHERLDGTGYPRDYGRRTSVFRPKSSPLRIPLMR